MSTKALTNMVSMDSHSLDRMLAEAGLSRSEFARLRGLTIMALHSWVRKERQKMPEIDIYFLKSFIRERDRLMKDGRSPVVEDVLKSMPVKERLRGSFDPLTGWQQIDPMGKTPVSLSRFTDGELADELEKRGYQVTLTRRPK